LKVRIWNYGNYSSDNYGSCRAVQIGKLILYFSYETVIAFEDGCELTIRENDWSTTTGRHLNCINENKKIRINSDKFEKNLEKTLKKYNLEI